MVLHANRMSFFCDLMFFVFIKQLYSNKKHGKLKKKKKIFGLKKTTYSPILGSFVMQRS